MLRRSVIATLSIVGILAAVLTGATPATAAARNTIPGSGTYLVGKDFQAGVYRSTSNSSCYWERASNASGSLSSILANDIGSGQRLVYVRSTDRIFKTSGCHTWNRVFSSVLKTRSTRTTILGNGAYLVGSDFRPGTYRSTGNSGSCYWKRARSADGTLGSIIANGISTGQLVVTISATDSVFETSRCTTWRRIG
jgi:hypothetical protein